MSNKVLDRELVEPMVSVEFIENIICCWGGDCLTSALEDRPQEQRLLNSIVLGYMVQINALQNGGKVEKCLAEWIKDEMPEAINTMSALGFQW